MRSCGAGDTSGTGFFQPLFGCPIIDPDRVAKRYVETALPGLFVTAQIVARRLSSLAEGSRFDRVQGRSLDG